MNTDGCDSTLTLGLTILNASDEAIQVSDCNPVEINGITYGETGTYEQILTNMDGCDSTLIIEYTLEEIATPEITQEGSTLLISPDYFSYQWINCDTQEPIMGANPVEDWLYIDTKNTGDLTHLRIVNRGRKDRSIAETARSG